MPKDINEETMENAEEIKQDDEQNAETEIIEEEIQQEQPEKGGNEEERLKELLKESDERYLRIVAEYDNYRKRTAKEREGIYPQATAETVGKFLPVLDNFERALEFEPNSSEFADGIKMIKQNFLDVLLAMGVEEIGKVGEPFDPELHNAVMHREDPELGENVIAQVLQKGYKIGDRIIRHAMVETAN